MRKRCNTMMLLCLAILWLPGAAFAATVTLPATGQSGCWDVNGLSIDCAGTGQDGAQLKGAAWPTPRFTDNSDQTVTDNLTGLMWTKDGNLPAATKTWQGALDNVAAMNSGAGTLGHNDWRLPNRKELMSLVNRQEANSAAWLNGQGFSNVQANYYWSSCSYAGSSDDAWFVYMGIGYVDGSGKSASMTSGQFVPDSLRHLVLWLFLQPAKSSAA